MPGCRTPRVSPPLCLTSLVALLFAWASTPAVAQLETRSTTGLPGHEPFQVAVADFNGDGKLDLAVVDQQLSILLGNGDGTFQKPINTPYSGLETSIAAADFNGDGKTDVVITAGSTGIYSVVVFLGNGDGTFQTPVEYATTELPTFVAVGNFNNDKKPDLVVINPPYISVMLGNGDGTFQAPIDNSSFPDTPVSLAAADFNNSGTLGVVVVGYFGSATNFGILLGNGDGTLQQSLTYPLDVRPFSVAAGDFNKDGNMDIVVAEGKAAVFLGNGDGTFRAEVDYAAPVSLVLAVDMNEDGNLDLVGSGVHELMGNGDGTFQPAQYYPAGDAVWSQSVGDFNGDHRPDVVVSDTTHGEIILLNTDPVVFSPSTPLVFPSQLINTGSSPKNVTLTNLGTVAVSIASIKVSGQFQSTNTCGGSLAAGANCTVSVSYHPLSPGWHNGLVTVNDSASSKPQVIEVSGLGTALKLSPTSLNFGTQKVGTKSAPQQITVTNEGSTMVTFNQIGIGGTNFQDFSIQSENCTPSLNAGASCAISVIFSPTKTGGRHAVTNVTVIGGANPAPIPVSGTGS